MKNSIGTEKTCLVDFTMSESISLLSSGEASLLEHVLRSLDSFKNYPETCPVDPRGVAVVHDQDFDDESIQMLIASDLVMTHLDSDESISYLSVNQDVFDFATSISLYTPIKK